MKQFIFICCLLATFQIRAQHPDLLDKTWYVQYVVVEGVQYDVITGGIFYGQVYFNEDTFDVFHPTCGEGFEANIIAYTGTDEFSFENSSVALLGDCADPDIGLFMNMHYNLYLEENKIARSPCTYTITADTNGLNLVVTNDVGDIGVYGDYLLETPHENQALAFVVPNPFKETISIQSLAPIDHMILYNLLGQEIGLWDSGFDHLNLSELTTGMYIAKVISNGKTATVKVLKE